MFCFLFWVAKLILVAHLRKERRGACFWEWFNMHTYMLFYPYPILQTWSWMHGVQIEYTIILKNPANWNSKAIWFLLHVFIAHNTMTEQNWLLPGLVIFLLYCVDSSPSDRFCWKFQVSFLQVFSPRRLVAECQSGSKYYILGSCLWPCFHWDG